MGEFMDKAKSLVDKYDKQVDRALDKVGDQVNRRTGGKYSEQISKGVKQAQRRTGQGEQAR